MSLQDLQQDKSVKRKFFILGVVLLAWMVWHTLPSLFSHHVQAKPAAPLASASKPSPAVVPAPAAARVPVAAAAAPTSGVQAPVSIAAPAVASASPPPAPDPLANVEKTFLGTWMGRGSVNQPPHARGCDLAIEVKRQDTAKDNVSPFAVFSTLNCMFQGAPRQPPIRDITSFALSGSGQPGVIPSIDFDTVTNAVGVKESAFGCSMRSLKLEAFGAGRISASWDETGGNAAFCNGGQIVMERRRFY